MADKSEDEIVFDRIARESRAAAAQAEILKDIVHDVPNYLDTAKLITVLSPEDSDIARQVRSL